MSTAPISLSDHRVAREVSRPQARSMWHVTLTVAGPTVDQALIRSGLERLSFEHPFLLSGRFAGDRAEVRYWEEALSVAEVSSMALGLWTEHRASAHLPEWEVVGVEIVDQETFHRRGRYVHEQPGQVGIGRVLPF